MDTKPSHTEAPPEKKDVDTPYNPMLHESTSGKEVMAVLITLIFTLVLLFVVVLSN